MADRRFQHHWRTVREDCQGDPAMLFPPRRITEWTSNRVPHASNTPARGFMCLPTLLIMMQPRSAILFTFFLHGPANTQSAALAAKASGQKLAERINAGLAFMKESSFLLELLVRYREHVTGFRVLNECNNPQSACS
jgi:hypothetical protein